MRPRSGVVLAAAVAVLLATVTTPPATTQDLEQVAARRQELAAELDAVTRRLEDLRARLAALGDELAALDRERRDLRAEARDAADAFADRVRTRYMLGNPSTFDAILKGVGPEDAVERAQVLELLTRRSTGDLERITALRTALEQNAELAAARRTELTGLEEELAVEVSRLQDALAEAQRLEAALRERRERQQRVDRGAQQGVYSCIFDRPYHFIDSWGFARSGGRSHKGADVMAPPDVNVYAFTSGRIDRLRSGGLGGIALHLVGDDGNLYYYAHLRRYAPGIRPGTRVEAGQLIALNGNSGNAAGGATHVHFQAHPGGGAPTNPYPWLRAVCP
ncbi:MAG: murein hydrolase activator EnvC family protein [Nitriliruptorales bacterium]